MRLMTLFLLASTLMPSISRAGDTINNFELPAQDGYSFQLSDWAEDRVFVVVFLGVECPLAKLYANRLNEMHEQYASRGVCFVIINSNQHDSLQEVADFARRHEIRFPVLKDASSRVADQFGATRSPEAFVLDNYWTVRYHGRIDDQYSPGTNRSKPQHRYVAEAVDQMLAWKPVTIPFTEPVGCFINKAKPALQVNYSKHIAPILNQHCVECHRPGQVAPFSLTKYQDAAAWSATIKEVVEQQRMPPWSADAIYGHFANERRLTVQEKTLLVDWIDFGAPEGDPKDLPAPPSFPDGPWSIEPDLVLSMKEPFAVPAEGILEYQDFVIDPNFSQDAWIQAVEIMPGNRSVVHHATVYLKPKGGKGFFLTGPLENNYLSMCVPGNTLLKLPPGMAKKVPAGWTFMLSIHYVPIGTAQTDKTRIAIQFADPGTVRQEVATKLMVDDQFVIKPSAADTQVEKAWRISDDLLLIAMAPHMHLRGRSMRFEADYPDGTHEVLLNVPHYDFMWQHRYALVEPKRLPAGTVLRCVANFDNSSANPNNPDPSATVKPGLLTTDEMFLGIWEVCLANQDLIAERRWRIAQPTIMVSAALALCWMVRRARRSHAHTYPVASLPVEH